MIATIAIADVPIREALRSLRTRPTADDVKGLRWADVALCVPLGSSRPPGLHRVGMVAFWDDEAASDAFAATHPLGRRLADGLHAWLRPLRAFGTWPGLPPDLPDSRAVPHDGPVVVLTLGQLQLTQVVRFIRTSRPAEKAATTADGMIWGTAAARPPFVATISMWESSQATAAYAYGRQRPQHDDAIAAQQRKDFHKRSAFVRFAPIRVTGSLDGSNPFAGAAIAV